MSKKKQVQTQPFDASRGSSVWAFQQFSEDALSNFLRDLLHAEKEGFTALQCERTQLMLKEMRIELSRIPDHTWFRRSIGDEVARFEKLYITWNHNSFPVRADAIAHRSKMWNRLTVSRNRIATRFRRNKAKLDEEWDLAGMRAWYGSLDALSKDFPEIFKNLSSAVANFARKLP